MAKHLLNFLFQLNNACDVCALAKQSRLSFSVSSISSIRPFELIHFDIWGPYKITTFLVQDTFIFASFFYSNWGGYLTSRGSTIGYCIFFGIFLYFLADKDVENRVPLFRRSRKQS
jgi:hypothetical protein